MPRYGAQSLQPAASAMFRMYPAVSTGTAAMTLVPPSGRVSSATAAASVSGMSSRAKNGFSLSDAAASRKLMWRIIQLA